MRWSHTKYFFIIFIFYIYKIFTKKDSVHIVLHLLGCPKLILRFLTSLQTTKPTGGGGEGGGAIKSKQTKFSNMEVLFIYINPNIE